MPNQKQTTPDRDTISFSNSAIEEAREATRERRRQNEENLLAYRGEQDWGEKLDDQSQETLPDFPVSVDQQVATLQRATTDTDDWFTVDDVGWAQSLLAPQDCHGLMSLYLSNLWFPGDYPSTYYDIQQFIGDAYRNGILESIVTCKVRPVRVYKRIPRLKVGKPLKDDIDVDVTELSGPDVLEWVDDEETRIDLSLIGFEDYFQDPTLARNWVCHEFDRTLWELKSIPTYDQTAVKAIESKIDEDAESYRRRRTGMPTLKSRKGKIRVREFWGNLPDAKNGGLRIRNAKWVQCGEYLFQKPGPNPRWDGFRPILSKPLNGIPLSTVHKALADHAVPMWRFRNELISLMMDGAIRSAWGIYQMRDDMLKHPDEVEAGLPQAYTGTIKNTEPIGKKFLERVDEGEVPNYAMQMLNIVDAQFQIAMATPDLKLGQLPPKEVRATEIVEAMAASGSLFEAYAARFEQFLESIFQLVWNTILQGVDNWVTPDIVQILGPEKALEMQRLGPAKRFMMLREVKFTIRGLRAVASKNRLFNKLAGLAQILAADPDLKAAYQKKYSLERLVELMGRNSGVVMRTLELTEDEQAAMAQAAVEQAKGEQQMEQQQMALQTLALTQPQAGQPGTQQPQITGGAPTPPALPTGAGEQQELGGQMAPKTPELSIPGVGIPAI